jgi:catechol 2,3-dioxygenase-like lactoylglutathione lyase family enzyme
MPVARGGIEAGLSGSGRPVLHVSNVEASLRFFADQLGFAAVAWRQEEDGRAEVAEVQRQSCSLILADHWPEKVGQGLIFISLNVELHSREAALAAVDNLRSELEGRGVAVKDSRWSQKRLVVEDLDGNQLFFPYQADPTDSPDGLHGT